MPNEKHSFPEEPNSAPNADLVTMALLAESQLPRLSRRQVLATAIGAGGLSLPAFLHHQASGAPQSRSQGKAKSCILPWGRKPTSQTLADVQTFIDVYDGKNRQLTTMPSSNGGE